jgi:hypothetical protein
MMKRKMMWKLKKRVLRVHIALDGTGRRGNRVQIPALAQG